MKPFQVSANLANLKGTYPDPLLLRDAAREGVESCKSIARLWITEGIPFAFEECPAVYDEARRWLGEELCVPPKHISLTGSARIGASLAPDKFGNTFNSRSDLDLFLICGQFFEESVWDFRKWEKRYRLGSVTPLKAEESYWKSNLSVCPNNINRGFIDLFKIPNRKEYSFTRKVYNVMWRLGEKLKITPGAPAPKKASLRCYRDWESAIGQISLNLRHMSCRLN